MANLTWTDIQNQIYQFLPHVNQSAKLTLVNNSIDYALESISNQHNFTCLRGTSVATATVTAGQYSLLETAFGPRVSSTSSIAQGVDWIKDIIRFWLFDTSSNVTKFVKFMDSREFDSCLLYTSPSPRDA